MEAGYNINCYVSSIKMKQKLFPYLIQLIDFNRFDLQ